MLASAESTNRSLQVNCTYVNLLPSSGCHIVVLGVSSDYYSAVYLQSVDSHSFPDLQSGSYTVLVYGVEREDEFSLAQRPDFFSVVNVSVPLETPTAPTAPTSAGATVSHIKHMINLHQVYSALVCLYCFACILMQMAVN